MKHLSKKVLDTNLSKLDAYKAMNTNDGMSAKDYTDNEFKLLGYVIYEGAITDVNEETGEIVPVSKGENIVLSTTVGFIGSNSPTIIGSFKDMLENFGLEDLVTFDLKISSATSKNGRTFYDLEIA